jgi:hypothetical protein
MPAERERERKREREREREIGEGSVVVKLCLLGDKYERRNLLLMV